LIWNVIDERKRRYRWKRINAAAEPVWHDNSCPDADEAERCAGESEYEKRQGITLAEAIAWASGMSYPVTLFLYDEGCGIR
jgi:hypothetical protein